MEYPHPQYLKEAETCYNNGVKGTTSGHNYGRALSHTSPEAPMERNASQVREEKTTWGWCLKLGGCRNGSRKGLGNGVCEY